MLLREELLVRCAHHSRSQFRERSATNYCLVVKHDNLVCEWQVLQLVARHYDRLVREQLKDARLENMLTDVLIDG